MQSSKGAPFSPWLLVIFPPKWRNSKVYLHTSEAHNSAFHPEWELQELTTGWCYLVMFCVLYLSFSAQLILFLSFLGGREGERVVWRRNCFNAFHFNIFKNSVHPIAYKCVKEGQNLCIIYVQMCLSRTSSKLCWIKFNFSHSRVHSRVISNYMPYFLKPITVFLCHVWRHEDRQKCFYNNFSIKFFLAYFKFR